MTCWPSFYGPKSTELGTIYKAYLTSKGLKEDDPGVAVGAKAAAAAIANAGRRWAHRLAAAPTSYVGATGMGARTSRPNRHKEMAGPHTGKFKGFVIKDGTQFRPGPPPDLKSEQYAKDYNEVKAVGAKENSTRTPEQTELADFYRSDYLCRTFQQVPQNVVKAHSKSLDDSARAMALAQMAAADTLITAWESKVHYNFWRPITAIHNGENDGNPATAGDPIGCRTWSRRPTPTTCRGPTRWAAPTTARWHWPSARTTCPSRSRPPPRRPSRRHATTPS